MTTEYKNMFTCNYLLNNLSLADTQRELLTDILQHKRKKWSQKYQ